MTKISSEIESNAAILNDKRLLRSHKAGGDGAYVKNEEQAINFKTLTNVKNWFRKNHCAPNHAANSNNLYDDFSKLNLETMLKKRKFKAEMFKKWDNYRIDELKVKIGQENFRNNAVTKMFMDYVKNHRPKNLYL
ncbi:unnamed protein product [Phytophthora lilii]|uniref:RxLR effector protein n=1 Tax=Phytophthora lilii TaxID=2077276 RepID=A0A9W6THV3_9STRA|nr:unnamed protein product [Phytophthora lilii]